MPTDVGFDSGEEPEFSFSEDLRYGFAVGEVRALEARLLGVTDYDRLLSGEHPVAVAKMLQSLGYDRWLDVEQPRDWSSGLEKAGDENRAWFLSRCLDSWLADFVELPNLMRGVRGHLKTQEELPARDRLSSLLLEEVRSRVGLKSDTSAVWVGSDRTAPPALDEFLDNLEFELLARLAPPGSFAAALLYLRKNAYRVLRQERLAARGAVEVPLGSGATAEERLRSLELAARKAEISFLKRARFTAFGYEPLLAFYYLVEHELRNVSSLLLPLGADAWGWRRQLVAYA